MAHALLIGPPTVLMGGTIPLLTQGLARGLDDATRFHSLVYAFNTAGAFAGALSAGFWLIPSLGLAGSLCAVSFLNLGAGGLFLLLGRRAASETPPALAPGATHSTHNTNPVTFEKRHRMTSPPTLIRQ